jgi:hypothetical protein
MNSLRDAEIRIFNKVNPAVRFSVSRFVFAIGIFVAIVVFGFVSIGGLGVDQLPTMNIPVGCGSATPPSSRPSRPIAGSPTSRRASPTSRSRTTSTRAPRSSGARA